jgi:hypothetical protein
MRTDVWGAPHTEFARQEAALTGRWTDDPSIGSSGQSESGTAEASAASIAPEALRQRFPQAPGN